MHKLEKLTNVTLFLTEHIHRIYTVQYFADSVRQLHLKNLVRKQHDFGIINK